MSTHTAGRIVAPAHNDDQRSRAWLARGEGHDRLMNRRFAVVAAVVACGLIGGVLIALVLP
jgi:hypothetical protein